MKHTFAFFIVGVIVIATLTISRNELSTQPTSELHHPIRLGATIPLTGLASAYGAEIRNGIELAISDLKKDGISAVAIHEDVNAPGPLAISAIRHLIDHEGIDALVANFFNPAIPAMKAAIMKAKLLAFHTAEADDLILESGDYIFTTNARIQDESRQLAMLAVNRFHAKKAAVLYVGTTWGENYNKHFEKYFKQLGGEVVYQEMTALNDMDVRTTILQALAHRPDVLITAYFGPTLGVVLKQALSQNPTCPILTAYEAENPAVLETAGSIRDRSVYFFTPENSRPSPLQLDFQNRYRSRYHQSSGIFAANAYDATILAVQAVSACKGLRDCAQHYVSQVRSYPGVSGDFSIDQDGAATRNFVLKTIANNTFVRDELSPLLPSDSER